MRGRKAMDPRTPTWALTTALLLLLAGSACSDSTTGLWDGDKNPLEPGNALLGEDAPITLDLEASSLAPGAPVTLVLSNGSDGEIGYNLCFHVLERLEEHGWTEFETDESRVCTAVLHMLESGGTAWYETSLPNPLPPAEYRFRVALHLMESGEFRDQVTPGFLVE